MYEYVYEYVEMPETPFLDSYSYSYVLVHSNLSPLRGPEESGGMGVLEFRAAWVFWRVFIEPGAFFLTGCSSGLLFAPVSSFSRRRHE